MQTVAQSFQLRIGHLLDLVRCIATFNLVAQCPTFDCLTQNRSWSTRAGVFYRGSISGVKLSIIVTATWQQLQVIIS